MPLVVAIDQATAPAPRWTDGTELQLMVIREINSRDVHPGERVKLRVNAPVSIDGVVAIPVGAWAWAEIVAASGTGSAGGKGQISLRLPNVETQWGVVPITGLVGAEGKSNTAGVVLGIIAWGPLGLLMKGGNASFKAGDIIPARIDAQAGEHSALQAVPVRQ
ncbi:hypothetical protein [Sphingomonas montanisoli]|uniref:Uncharacterized protein n=1 Tax=Sphingomonas montanisoli TaxID=2606412 RepID=A0A5D9C3C7_9SPHN|nr:hypothetical protein [Sphingomonas montanisoli]TZG25963.1 hypothetical protein FYJ91_13400 [Sphingomonas montanisoli]